MGEWGKICAATGGGVQSQVLGVAFRARSAARTSTRRFQLSVTSASNSLPNAAMDGSGPMVWQVATREQHTSLRSRCFGNIASHSEYLCVVMLLIVEWFCVLTNSVSEGR